MIKIENAIARAITQVCASQHNGQFGASVVLSTEPTMNKRGNPYLGRVRKVTYYNDVMIGCEYANVVTNRAERSSGVTEKYDPQASKCGAWIDDNYKYCRQKPNTKQCYFQFIFRLNTNPKPIWFVDNRIATSEEIEVIKSFLSGGNKSYNKQHDYGIIDGEEVDIRCPKVENVMEIRFSENVSYRADVEGVNDLIALAKSKKTL